MAFPYIKVYKDFITIAETLDTGARGRLFLAVLQYANGMEVAELTGAEKIAYLVIKGQIDRDGTRGEEVSASRSAAGKKGADSRWQNDGKNSNCHSADGKNGNLINKDKEEDKDKDKKLFPPDSKPYKCALFLAEEIRKRLPQGKPADERILQNWSDSFDKVNRIDGYDWETIADVLEFSQADSFWRTNILSGSTFRKQFVKLYAKLPEGQREEAPRKPIKGKVIEIADEDGNIYKKFMREGDSD